MNLSRRLPTLLAALGVFLVILGYELVFLLALWAPTP